MTNAEKLMLFKEKKDFIENLNKAFQTFPKGSTVASVAYEVYAKKVNEDVTYYQEYLVVTFFGGAKAVRNANGNSNLANFKELGKLVEGGYYDEVKGYLALNEAGYNLIQFNTKPDPLTELLAQPMKHISDVTRCFEYCANINDIEKVIRMIPGMFGHFDVEFDEEYKSFTITNIYDDGGVLEEEEYAFDLYCED